MRHANVQYHIAEPNNNRWSVPVRELQELFASAGVTLNLAQGEALDIDPMFSRRYSYQALIDRYAKTGRSAGHLVIGLEPPALMPSAAGELHDLATRGLAAVYTRSDYIQQNGDNALLQSCAHELGHMLNLAHEDVSPQYDSVMNQAKDRDQAPSAAWSYVALEADQIDHRHHPAYYWPPTVPLDCYPFAYSARSYLNTNPDQRFLPWGSRYDRPYDGAEDRWTRDLGLTLEPEADTFIEGGPFAFKLRLRNLWNNIRSLPIAIGPEFDTLILVITRPDGTRYHHRPRSLICARGVQLLSPGQEVVVPFMTIRGPGGSVFPMSGHYLVTATIPAVGAKSQAVDIDVRPRSSGVLCDRRFRQFLADGAPWRRTAMVRRLDTALSDKEHLEPVARSYLALVRSLAEPDPESAAALLATALADTAPSAVRRAAAAHHVRLGHRTRSFDRARKRAEAVLDPDQDALFLKALEGYKW